MESKRPKRISLTRRQRKILKEFSNGRKCPRGLANRARIILYWAQGRGVRETGREMEIDTKTVLSWRQRWQTVVEEWGETQKKWSHKDLRDKIRESFSDAARSGAPPKFTAEEVCRELPAISVELYEKSERIREFPMLLAANEASKIDSTGDFQKLGKQQTIRTGENEILIVTKKGQSIRFKEKDIRAMGRTAAGIKAIRLKKDDEVVGMNVIPAQKEKGEDDPLLLVVSENGYGKRTAVSEYRVQTRGGSGIKTANVTSKTGDLVYAKVLSGSEEDLIVISQQGQVIRTEINSIAQISRSTQGVRIMRLDDADRVVSAASV